MQEPGWQRMSTSLSGSGLTVDLWIEFVSMVGEHVLKQELLQQRMHRGLSGRRLVGATQVSHMQ